MIPIIIICYNNYKYVENTINQIKQINALYFNDIIILDNKSSEKYTIDFLKNTKCKVINNIDNLGPRISQTNNKHIYDMMPDKFIITDPDLEFNSKLPHNFINILEELSELYCTYKIGFSLHINEKEFYENMFTYVNPDSKKNIYEWELSTRINKITDENYELYGGHIDTTFCLINKNYSNNRYDIRVAGNFTAKHIPWYIKNDIYNFYELYKLYTSGKKWSSINCFFTDYINKNYTIIQKKKQELLINKKSHNISFWNNYSKYQEGLFNIIDKYADENKCVITIGEIFGEYSIYCSRTSKNIFMINDKKNISDEQLCELKYNIECNYYNKNNINVILEDNFNIDSCVNELENSFNNLIINVKQKYNICDNVSIILVNTTNKNVINQTIIYSIKNNIPVLII